MQRGGNPRHMARLPLPDGELMLIYIAPDNLHEHWPLVRTGLQRILDRTHDRWLPEDVYLMLKGGTAALFVQDNGKGFAVMQNNRGWDGNELFIFAGYSTDGHQIVLKEIEAIKDIARQYGCKRIKFQTRRRGWEKAAQEIGYEPTMTEYEVSL